MSVYCYLACRDCHESLFVKDSDSEVHADPEEHAQFLEKHYMHRLVFGDENASIKNVDSDWMGLQDMKRFKAPTDGWWSTGNFFPNDPT